MFRTLLLVSALFSVAFACTCVDGYYPEKRFCSSDAVGVFRILKRFPGTFPHGNDTALTLSHYVAPQLVFKSVAGKNGAVNQPNPAYITIVETNSQVEACGLTWLEEGDDYLLNGDYDYERRLLKVSTCRQIAPTQWRKVPVDIKKALKNGTYKC